MEDRKYDLMLSDEAKEAIVMETALKRNTAAFENPLTERLKTYYNRIREFCGDCGSPMLRRLRRFASCSVVRIVKPIIAML